MLYGRHNAANTVFANVADGKDLEEKFLLSASHTKMTICQHRARKKGQVKKKVEHLN